MILKDRAKMLNEYMLECLYQGTLVLKAFTRGAILWMGSLSNSVGEELKMN
ncbi:hypothetical protein HMPREF1987_00810 [Peptostreptococcaceae bacterium oral taxon 113 str. W5053]|nr:hypothetical protein HMPREF1987_00810 [Peptostreptococcaceae bacterium oral taxon 113 str. W5053]